MTELEMYLEVAWKMEEVWGGDGYLSRLQVDQSKSVWHNACDNYRRLYPRKYQDYLTSAK